MRISIFGLGYVGCVSAACFAEDGHAVMGVDNNPVKVDLINSGRSPIIEPGLESIIAKKVADGSLRATSDAVNAIASTDISFVCVGTPSTSNGGLDLQYVKRVALEIGAALREKNNLHSIVYRSTMLPGSMENVVIPTLEQASGKTAGQDFNLAYNPEFLREGSAIADFYNPPRTVIGELHPGNGNILAEIYANIIAPLVRTNLRTAEMVKYADNAFHGLKIAFGNEIGALCREAGVDSHQLMDIFCLDTKLNLSPIYLRPGNAFGGSCIPKDLRAITYYGRSVDVNLPVLEAILNSNEEHKKRALELVMSQGKKKIGFLGLSFKEDTDDLRESPTVELLERLIGKGYTVNIYDHNVSLSRLMGANKIYIERELPHIACLLLPTLDEILERAEVIVIANRSNEFVSIAQKLRPDQKVIDLVRLLKDGQIPGDQYDAIVG